MQSNRRSVLVVEDESLIRMSIVDSLHEKGLEVVEAANSTEALYILSNKPHLDVLFTDVDMPGGIDGLELAWVVSRIRPKMKIIVSSGHRMPVDGDLPKSALFLSKPVNSSTLLAALSAGSGF